MKTFLKSAAMIYLPCASGCSENLSDNLDRFSDIWRKESHILGCEQAAIQILLYNIINNDYLLG
jgi:hypothetical protein